MQKFYTHVCIQDFFLNIILMIPSLNKRSLNLMHKGVLDNTFIRSTQLEPNAQKIILQNSCINNYMYVHSCLKPLSNIENSMFKSWDSRAD